MAGCLPAEWGLPWSPSCRAGKTGHLLRSPGWRLPRGRVTLLFWTSKGDFKDAWKPWGDGEKGQGDRRKQQNVLEVPQGYFSVRLRNRRSPGGCQLKGSQRSAGGDLEGRECCWRGEAGCASRLPLPPESLRAAGRRLRTAGGRTGSQRCGRDTRGRSSVWEPGERRGARTWSPARHDSWFRQT